jgi:[acyl-carrier-protein] S-malonyltransferase
MGKDFADTYPVARQTFEQADDILGLALSKICFAGPEEDLNDTINTQPALYVSGVAILRVLGQMHPDAQPRFVAGHSLGELTALAAAEAMSFEDGLRLVHERGRLMKEAGIKSPGAMAALLGLAADVVRDICARTSQLTGGVLVLANDNCPGQIVISGDESSIEQGLILAREAGAKRAVKLAVSIAAHSPLMQPASDDFRKALQNTAFHMPRLTVYANVTAAPLTSVEAIRDELGSQLTSSVRWTESVAAMVAAGAQRFIELGPKDVLTGLVKRIDRNVATVTLNNAASLEHIA